MKDQNKTKKQLINELMELRQRIAELEKLEKEHLSVKQAGKRAEEKYRSIFENAVEGIHRATVEGRYISVNPALARIYGYESPEDLMNTITDIAHQLYVNPNHRSELIRLLQEKNVLHNFETQVYRKDGGVIWISTNIRAVKDNNGRLIYYEGTVEDITERKRAEEALRESEKRFKELFDEAPIGYHELDTEGRITRVNRTELEMLGYSAEEMLGQPVWKFILEEETSQQSVMAKIAGVKPFQKAFERTFRRKDGTTVPVLLEEQCLRDREGRIVGIRSTQQDITERKRAEEELRKAHEMLEKRVEERTGELSKANELLKQEIAERKQMEEKLLISERLATLGLFSGSISHELKNPLSTIDSSVYYLKTKLKDADEKVRTHLDRIKSSVGSTLAIIDSLRNLTQIKEPRLERLDLISITFDAIANSKVPGTVNVIRNITEQEVLVNADPEQLKMAFKNIVNNAIQAMDGKGTLEVTVRKINGQAEVSFTDTGSGIAPENLDKIFQPLFSTKAKGLGFGLSIAKMIIDKHSSTIEAKSEPGKGATILIRLPLYIQS